MPTKQKIKRKPKPCPHCAAMQHRLDNITYSYRHAMSHLPEIFKHKDTIIQMIPRLCQWAKNTESDRTAVRKAQQELDVLVNQFFKKTHLKKLT